MSEIKEYAYSDTKQLTAHFNVKEFRCKCGRVHSTKLSGLLVTKLEELYKRLNCTKIIVNSGYRCPAHDASPQVGGNGYGQHTLGTAADIVCYGKDGKIISTKIVSCVAQDLGFMGIGNIDRSYTAIHVDVRTTNKWYGDETVNNNTVTSNFYAYYGVTSKMIADVTGVQEASTGNVSTTNATTATEAAHKFDKSLEGKYKVSATALNVRSGAGTTKPIMVTIPTGTTVRCYGYYNDVAGVKWLYVQFNYKNKTYTGFASSDWLIKS